MNRVSNYGLRRQRLSSQPQSYLAEFGKEDPWHRLRLPGQVSEGSRAVITSHWPVVDRKIEARTKICSVAARVFRI